MDSTDLTREQAHAVNAAVRRHLRYLGRLRARMEKRGFPPGDPLFRRVCEAYVTAQALSVALHYLSCDPGSVGGR